MIRVVDFSEYQRLPSQAWFEGLVTEHGVEGVVIQAWGGGPNQGRRNDYYHRAMGRAQAAGLALATYVWPSEDVNRGALDYIDSAGLKPDWVGLDVEAGSRPLERDKTITHLRGHIPVAYTFPHYWINTIGNPQVWGDLPLWLSRGVYSSTHQNRTRVWWPDFYNPYGTYAGRIGQWGTTSIGWQFQGTTALTAGGETVGVDLNLFREWPQPTRAPEPTEKEADEDTMRLVKTNDSSAVWAVSGGVRKHIANKATLDMLRYMMAAENPGVTPEIEVLDWEFLRRTTTELGLINLQGWNPNG